MEGSPIIIRTGPGEVVEPVRPRSMPHLTKFIRLTIYSYLSMGSVLKVISYLSRQERDSLRDSLIAREGKRAIFDLKDLLREECLMHGAKFDRVMTRIDIGLSLCNEVEFLCSRDMISQCQEHSYDEVLAFFLTSLPRRFDKKISMRLGQAKSKVNLKTFWLTMRARCPDFAL